MFKYKCFIRENNDFLRNTLRKIGYVELSPIDGDVIICTNDGHGMNYYTTIKNSSVSNLGEMYIDCGKSETLFLGISAITDEHDKFQFFTSLADMQWVNQETYMPKGSFVLCLVKDWYFGENPLFDSFSLPARKSTIKELFDNFKDKGEDTKYYSTIKEETWKKTDWDFEKYPLSEDERKRLEELNEKDEGDNECTITYSSTNS